MLNRTITPINPSTRVMTGPRPALYGVPMEDNVYEVARGITAANYPREPIQPPGETSR